MLIEKSFGLLKRRFPALRHGLRLKRPEDVHILITAALVLHNMLIKWRDSEILELDTTDEDETPDDRGQETDDARHDDTHNAQNIRSSIIDEYFS